MIEKQIFKEGDIIVMKETCSSCIKDNEYLLKKHNGVLYTTRINKMGKIVEGCSCQNKWILKDIRIKEIDYKEKQLKEM